MEDIDETVGCTSVRGDEMNEEIIIENDASDEIVEPYIGMEFGSLEEAGEFYNNYGKSKGFGTRKSRLDRAKKHGSRKDGAIIGREFVCSKEGYRRKEHFAMEGRTYEPTDETREGCKAMLHISLREDRWVVRRFIKEHNHILASPRSTQFIRSHRKRTKVQKQLIDVLDESGVRPNRIVSVLASESGGIENLNMTDRDVYNYLSLKRQKDLEKGDAQMMLNYFKKCQSTNLGFFYSIQMDIDGRMANCFWADTRSRMAYKYFGDVVAFDPTYLTNKYKLPFVPFAGVNHHFQTVLFGCALLWDETEDSFVWLLETWLEAMGGCAPKTIITDQDMAMTNAIAKVLPDTTHHFCMWHIEKKFPENLSRVYCQNADFKAEFNKCIHQSITPDEFEDAWGNIMNKYDLYGIDWLHRIYLVREKWVPAFVRQSFCAGMSTTQRSESLNKLFKDYLNASTPVSKFVVQFEKALDGRYHKEREKTFKTMSSKPVLKTSHPMEAAMSTIYTRKVFRMFQDELANALKFVVEKTGAFDRVKQYNLHELGKRKPMFAVTYDASSNEASCTCRLFEFKGILCSHILCVFMKKNIFTLPEKYILPRWTIDAKKHDGGDYYVRMSCDNESESLWFNSTMRHCLTLSELSARSKTHYILAERGIKDLCGQLVAVKLTDIGNEDIVEEATIEQSQEVLKDPQHVTTKGRPRSLRLKAGIEKCAKTVTCSVCKKQGHTKRKCPEVQHVRTGSSSQPLSHMSEVEHQGDEAATSQTAWHQSAPPFGVRHFGQTTFTDLMRFASQSSYTGSQDGEEKSL